MSISSTTFDNGKRQLKSLKRNGDTIRVGDKVRVIQYLGLSDVEWIGIVQSLGHAYCTVGNGTVTITDIVEKVT